MKKPKVDMSGVAMAQQAIADAQKAASTLQKNFSADLKNENLTQISAGGTAEAMAPTSGTRKKKQGGGLASQLGLNL